MLGIPASDTPQIFEWTNTILGVGDPEYGGTYERLMEARLRSSPTPRRSANHRAADPTDDITSALMAAELDGDQLTPQEFGSFFILLVVAGNETTRNAISHGVKALSDHPEQRERWFGDFDAHARTAVEEIVRWATPVIHFRRTVTDDTSLGGEAMRAGDKVVLFYESANRDERVFAGPSSFDIAATAATATSRLRRRRAALLPRRQPRPPRDHDRCSTRSAAGCPTCGSVAEPDYLQSNFINGIKRLPCRW